MEAQTLRPEAARLAAALEPSQARGREVMRVAPAERAAAVAALRHWKRQTQATEVDADLAGRAVSVAVGLPSYGEGELLSDWQRRHADWGLLARGNPFDFTNRLECESQRHCLIIYATPYADDIDAFEEGRKPFVVREPAGGWLLRSETPAELAPKPAGMVARSGPLVLLAVAAGAVILVAAVVRMGDKWN